MLILYEIEVLSIKSVKNNEGETIIANGGYSITHLLK